MNEPDVVASIDAELEPSVEAPPVEQSRAPDAEPTADPTEVDAGNKIGAETRVAEDHDAIDLDTIERDLTDVQAALDRLNDGTYWSDEVTGEPIPDDVLAAHPTARTASPTL